MTIAIKQPLTLADNLSAFDAQTPLILSDIIQNRIQIPIADRSAVSTSKVVRGQSVKGYSKRDMTGKIVMPSNVERLTHTFTVDGERAHLTFSQEVQYGFVYILEGGGTAFGYFLTSWIPEYIQETLQVRTPYLLTHRSDVYDFKMSGSFVEAILTIDGYY